MKKSFLKQSIELQQKYNNLIKNKKLTKKAICDLCIPFRDMYGLTDVQVLKIARNEMKLSELINLSEKQNDIFIIPKKIWVLFDCPGFYEIEEYSVTKLILDVNGNIEQIWATNNSVKSIFDSKFFNKTVFFNENDAEKRLDELYHSAEKGGVGNE